MASEADIANFALTLLGESRIMSLDDNVKPARELKALFPTARDAMIGAYNWSFAKTRAQLVASIDAPAFQYLYQFPMPNDCLRLIRVGDFFVGLDLTDYRGSPTDDFTIEGRNILTNFAAPLNVVYGRRVTGTTKFHPCFVQAFAGRLAAMGCEPITQSDSKRERAEAAERRWISEAIKANAIELPAQKLADDEWLLSRL